MSKKPSGSEDQTRSVAQSCTLGDRDRADGCPGALSFHHAEDGAIGRLRFPGGSVDSSQWMVLADLSDRFGDGFLHVTTRGNIQIRGISDEAGFTTAVLDSGAVPSPAHDKIRNIICSPLSSAALELAQQLDKQLLKTPAAAGLSGRTMFAIDAGDGRVLAQEPDFGALLCATTDRAQLILGGQLREFTMPKHLVPETLVGIATHWQEIRGSSWRVAERTELHEDLIARAHHVLDAGTVIAAESASDSVAPGSVASVGWIDLADGSVALAAGYSFGVLTSEIARVLSAIEKPVVVTPWHTLVISELDEAEAEQIAKVLAPMGLIFDAHSPRLRITACTGRPGCAKSLSDVRRDAMALAQSLQLNPEADGERESSELVHFSGCQRRCGHPRTHYVDYLATGDGEYEVSKI